ncbi:MAG: PDZ domain-containing protein [Anaerolineae bacterium]
MAAWDHVRAAGTRRSRATRTHPRGRRLRLGIADQQGAGSKAGLLQGDIIVAVDGVALNLDRGLRDVLWRYRAGDNVTLTLDRGGKTVETKLTLDRVRGVGAGAAVSDGMAPRAQVDPSRGRMLPRHAPPGRLRWPVPPPILREGPDQPAWQP